MKRHLLLLMLYLVWSSSGPQLTPMYAKSSQCTFWWANFNFFKGKRVFVKNILVQTKKILLEICNFNSLSLSALFGINYFAPIYWVSWIFSNFVINRTMKIFGWSRVVKKALPFKELIYCSCSVIVWSKTVLKKWRLLSIAMNDVLMIWAGVIVRFKWGVI